MINKNQFVESLKLARAILRPAYDEKSAFIIYADKVLESLIDNAPDIFKAGDGFASIVGDDVIISGG